MKRRNVLAALLALSVSCSSLPALAQDAAEEETTAVAEETTPVVEETPTEETAPAEEEAVSVTEEREPAAEEEATEEAAEIVASGECGENAAWTLDADGVLTIGGSGPMQNCPREQAPWYGMDVRRVVVQDGITTVSSGAFYGCDKLESVSIGADVEVICYDEDDEVNNCFEGCSVLKEIQVSEKNTTYRSVDGVLYSTGTSLLFCPYAYTGTLTVAEGTKGIADWACEDRAGITEVRFPDSLTRIGLAAFSGCTALTQVTIPDETSLDSVAFCDCTGLERVELGRASEFAVDAFRGCSNLKSITVAEGSGNYSSLDGVLYNAEQTKLILCPEGMEGDYVMPDTVTEVQRAAIYQCNKLKSITISPNVTSLPTQAVVGCSSIRTIVIPKGLTELSFGGSSTEYFPSHASFYRMTGLTEFVVEDGNPSYCSVDGVLFNREQTVLLQYPEAREGAYVVPDTVTSIKNCAFFRAVNLTEVTLPELPWIDQCTFYGCESLTAVHGGAGVSEIRDGAFWHCTSLTEIALPDTLKTIHKYAFRDCPSFKEVIIPDSVTSMGNWAFSGCTGLERVTLSNYCAALKMGTFSDCTSLKELTIPNGVTEVRDDCFHGCTALETLRLPHTLTIRPEAFRGCTALRTVTSDDATTAQGTSATLVYSYAFADCTSLSKVILPSNCEKINKYAFDGCTSLRSLTIGNGTCTIGKQDPIPKQTTIYGVNNSKVENYAKRHGIRFVARVPSGGRITGATAKTTSITVRWSKKTSKAKGYQVQLKQGDTWKTVTIKGNGTTSKTFRGLSKKTRYQVRVRAYNIVNESPFYGKWSDWKSIKTKS